MFVLVVKFEKCTLQKNNYLYIFSQQPAWVPNKDQLIGRLIGTLLVQKIWTPLVLDKLFSLWDKCESFGQVLNPLAHNSSAHLSGQEI